MSLKLDSLYLIEVLYGQLVEGLSILSLLSVCLFVLACWISFLISWITLLVLGLYSSPLDNNFGFLCKLGVSPDVKQYYLLLYCFQLFCKGVILPDIKTVFLFLWCDNSSYDSFCATGRWWIVILSIRLNVNWSRWILHHS